MNQPHYMPKKKQTEQKKQRLDEVTFSMTSICAKIIQKLGFLGEEKIHQPKVFSRGP